ncbi:MAG: RNA polymerase sigma factor [Janthinobacterium lividum]
MRKMRDLPPSSVTDQQLVARVLGGNTAAFRHIVQRTEGLVTQLVFKMIRHPADRPDIAQEVYLKVFKSLAGFKFQAKLSTWVGQITYNTCLHYLEKKQLVLLDPAEPAPNDAPEEGRRAPPPLLAGPDYDPETALFGHDLAGILGTAIEQLPPLYRTLVSLYHQQELSYEEIAQITSLPDGTVKNYLFRARKLLKQQLLTHYQRDDL